MGRSTRADDRVYSVASGPDITSATSVGLLILDGPLGNGHYRFTAKSTISDTAGNPLDGNGDGTGGDDYVRVFDVILPANCRVGRARQRHPGDGHPAGA